MKLKRCYCCNNVITQKEALDTLHFIIDTEGNRVEDFFDHLVEAYSLIKCAGPDEMFLDRQDLEAFAYAVDIDVEAISHREGQVVICMLCAYSAARNFTGPMDIFGYPRIEKQYQLDQNK